MNDEQRQELQAFANENGRTWRSKLRMEWLQGSEILRWARNGLTSAELYSLDIQPQRAYFLVLVRDSKTEPWQVHFGDYDRKTAKQEAIDYKNETAGRAYVRVDMLYTSGQQCDVDAFVNALNVKEGLAI